MKNLFFLLCLIINYNIFCQIPSVNIKTINGGIINTSEFQNNNNPIIISFWATWCKPCKEELENIHEVYEEWVEETNVKLIAISIDDARNASKIKPLVNSKGWEYEVYHDSNSEFATQMGVKPIPHTFLLDGTKTIVWNHTGYTDGDEEDLYEKILEIID
ncbi:MAG: thiol:disulfide interchange protein [Flavobacteriales bacterium]|nr:thiol:disulfide interchange protein [Flavobacteriales bacterium]|tara:strand:+ start:871 stop:1350 length:480 start_codon:yes stop_codon:yes gene_type:complete